MELGLALFFGLILFIYFGFINKNSLELTLNLKDVTLTADDLKLHGEEIAKVHHISGLQKSPKILLKKLKANYKRLAEIYQYLNEKSKGKRQLSAPSEWFLDNFYLIEEAAKETEKSIKEEDCPKLQILDRGYLRGYPRIYAVALELISHTDGRLEQESLVDFIASYQKQRVLSMSELETLPLVMKVALLDYLGYLAEKTFGTEQNWDKAVQIAALDEKDRSAVLEEMFNEQKGVPAPSFVEHLIKELRRQAFGEETLKSWLEEQLLDQGISLEEIVEQEHFEQASRKITVGHAIVSLKKATRFNWDEVFESLSKVESILQHDPDKIYAAMDEASRNNYRFQIKQLAKKYQVMETKVARLAVGLAKQNSDNKQKANHVGYYLIGNGKRELANALGSGDKVGPRHLSSGVYYFGAIVFLMILFLLPLILSVSGPAGVGSFFVSVILLLALIPVSEISIFLVNYFVHLLIKPTHLPKLAFKEGIPEAESTMVVIPCLVPGPEKVRQVLSSLEVYYLANREQNLYFTLVGDFKDADREELAEDELIVQAGLEGVAKLNRLYSDDKDIFNFAQRKRRFSPTQNRWTGWERKRGALIQFNRLLLEGNRDGYESLSPGLLDLTGEIKNIITLDGDTRLTLGMAKKLVSTIAHPLNKAVIDHERGIVKEGYGLIQPRIGVGIREANQSAFAGLFAGEGGIDPYTTAISDLYQDLFGEGIFTGKGIYNLQVFDSLLSRALPEESILSHDLLEGSFLRTGLATDLELVDGYPATYASFSARFHRWARGDWQLFPWLLAKVSFGKDQRATNPLTALSKWKIFDNIRRSLLPFSQLLLLFLGMVWFPGNSLLLLSLALIPFFLPLVNEFSQALRSVLPFLFLTRMGEGLYRALLLLAFLPHQAGLLIDAAIRSLYRVYFSRRYLLEWVTAAEAEKNIKNDFPGYLKRMQISPIAGVLLILLSVLIEAAVPVVALPFALLWVSAPWLAFNLSKKLEEPKKVLSQEEENILRRLARKTWAYYEEFAGEDNNFLPPDNFQLNPANGLALRTSPTNIGFLLLATLAAGDLGYLTATGLVERIKSTIKTIRKMETWKGHLFNWYHTVTLEPLRPFFISTVDSGNLAGYLLVVQEGLRDYLKRPLWGQKVVAGLQDTFKIAVSEGQLTGEYAKWQEAPATVREKIKALGDLKYKAIREGGWSLKLVDMAASLTEEMAKLWPQASGSDKLKQLVTAKINPEEASLLDLRQSYQDVLQKVSSREENFSEQDRLEIELLLDNVEGVCKEIEILTEEIQSIFDEMDFAPLYNEKQGLFAIGYSKEEEKLTDSYYDLLASEARLISYLAICKREAPESHWFKLGRSLALVDRERGLVSWTGTMFEYLMPSLVMKHFNNTLLAETYRTVLSAQEGYGNKRNVPWGTSESGYYGFDSHLNYQYKAFGVPDLGLKRGLVNDMVISPYSTFLALPFEPAAAMKNINRLLAEGLEGEYGLYEAIDYTLERLPAGEEKKLVESFMAHHLGMSLTAINNYFHQNIMQQRFHANPLVQGGEILLEERLPYKAIITKEQREHIGPLVENEKEIVNPIRHFERTEQVLPNCQILSNGSYFLLITDRGGGYSTRDGIQMFRWRKDLIEGNYGFFFLIKCLETNRVWSPTFEPLREEPDHYRVSFSLEKAVFTRTDDLITTRSEIVVAPEDDVEIRKIIISNNSPTEITVEVTSYGEIVLGDQNGDLAHPAFSNLFIKTEVLTEEEILLASRRPRSSLQKAHWAFHGLLVEGEVAGQLQFETNRGSFLGRNRSMVNPEGPEKTLSGISGTVLDPIFSLRRRVKIPSNQNASISWFSGYGENREASLNLARKYRNQGAIQRAFEMAKTRSQVEAHFLDLAEEQIALFDDLLPHLVFNSPLKINYSEQIRQNSKGQPALWAYGISGDLPIVLLTVETKTEIELVKEMIRAHEYWRVKGLAVDLVILNEDKSQYLQPMQDLLRETVAVSYSKHLLESSGGIYIRNAGSMPEEDVQLFYTVARIVLSGKQPIRAQLRYHENKLPPKKQFSGEVACYQSDEEAVDLQLWNGFGGFAQDGREYVIRLREGIRTPTPWINVIANPEFGFQVSESGSGFVWAENSRENKLTPWSNDPVTDPINEVIYLRDEKNGSTWTITPLPIREEVTYTVHHGLGYTRFHRHGYQLEQEQILFVPQEGTIKISLVNLTNNSDETKDLSVFYYLKPVLGVHWEVSAPYLVSNYNRTDEVLTFNNQYQADFPQRQIFMASSEKVFSFTGDRREFVGREGHLDRPRALAREKLSGRVGAGLDPCGAIQVKISLAPGEKKELVFLLGQGLAYEQILAEVNYYRHTGNAKVKLAEVIDHWEELLSKIQVRTPDTTMDLMMNNWLMYQNIVCRLWARSAFYQCGGAYGYRDQLQDSLNILPIWPELTRDQLLLHAAHQFKEGDVQHWWHPKVGDRGVRTRFTDDRLWLPFVLVNYLEGTKDYELLNAEIPFLEGDSLEEGEDEKYFTPVVSEEKGSLYEHCVRAIDISLQFGDHGLPLMGSGDWNDGMSTVGNLGKGESCWLGWFLLYILNKFIPVCELMADYQKADQYRNMREQLAETLEKEAWDGAWYRRAYFDDGTPLGSQVNNECSIDSLSQSWAAIAQGRRRDRIELALKALEKNLIDRELGVIKLFTPPFENGDLEPGYIKGYVAGVRENGAQYTHAATWAIKAFAILGQGDKAWELFHMINPLNHARTSIECAVYRVEPYVVAADVYTVSPQAGRGGWTWYTGAAGWFYNVGLEDILGFKIKEGYLIFDPCIPGHWKEFQLNYRYGNTKYQVTVENADGVNKGVREIQLDGAVIKDNRFPLVDDGKNHQVKVIMSGVPKTICRLEQADSRK
ncbi:MAG: glucoamylase family protein [Bacillota bacterium]